MKMRASVGMAVGLLLVGLSGYVYLAVTGHSSTPTNAAALSSLYFLAGLVTLGVFMGLEQETSRSVSRAIAEGRPLRQVARTSRRHAGWLLAIAAAGLAVLAPVLVSGPLRGQWSLFGALVVAAASGAACFWVRGLLGGRQEFWGYSATLAMEGLGRLVPCVVVFFVAGGVAWLYGLAFAAAQGMAAVVGARWLAGIHAPHPEMEDRDIERREADQSVTAVVAESPDTERREADQSGTAVVAESQDIERRQADQSLTAVVAEDRDTEISEFESGERSAAGSLALLVAASMLTQLVANLPPLAASSRLTHADTVAAAFGQAFVLVRIPLLLTSPIQAMLLPALTRSAARDDHAALRARVRVSLAAVAALGVLGTAALALAGPSVLRVFFGTRASLSHALLAVLGIGTVFLMSAAILQPTLVALNRHRVVPLAWGIGAAVLAVLVALPVDPLHAAAAGGVGGPLTVVAVMAFGLRDALREGRSR